MSQRVEEFGEIDGRNEVYAKFDDGERVIFPAGYKGYEKSDGSDTPNWKPVIETITGDHLLSGELQLDDSLSNWHLDIEAAVERLVDQFDDIEEEKQAYALIEYLASEDIVYGEDDNNHIQLDEDGIKFFEEDDIDSMGTNRNVEGIYNAMAVVSSTITSLNNYLQQADEIKEKMQEMSNDIETENLFTAKEKAEKAKRQLIELGPGNGMPNMEDLSEGEKEKAVRITQRYEWYQRVDELNFDFAENIVNVEFDDYHEFLENQQDLLKTIEVQLQEVAAKIKKGEELDNVKEVQSTLKKTSMSLTGEKNNMKSYEKSVDEYERTQDIMDSIEKGGETFETDDSDGQKTTERDDDEIMSDV